MAGVMRAGGSEGGRRLVIARCGDHSLHPQWFAGGGVPRFDFAISYYGGLRDAYPGADHWHSAPGSKLQGVHAFLMDRPDILERYDYIWLADDDIATDVATINRMFELAEAHRLDIAQPSLSWDSHYSIFDTMQNRALELRWTDYVEAMVPLFSSRALRRVLPAFRDSRYCWGVDVMWAHWLPQPDRRTAILDAVCVTHTRPVGGGDLYDNGLEPAREEGDRLLKLYGRRMVKPRAAVYAALDRKGEIHQRGLVLALLLAQGWLEPRKPGERLEMVERSALAAHIHRALTTPAPTPLPLPGELAG